MPSPGRAERGTAPSRDPATEALIRVAADRARAAPEQVTVQVTSSQALIAIVGELVVKLHRAGTERRALAARLELAAELSDAAGLLAPRETAPLDLAGPDGVPRVATVWPLVDPVRQDPETAPWGPAGAELARLHRAAPAPGRSVPRHGAVRRLQRAIRGIREARARSAEHRRARELVLRALDGLPAAAWSPAPPGRPVTLVHGDWHLGQLGRPVPGSGPDQRWLLFDLDDLGFGDPAWDFARPAAFWAAGLMPDAHWHAFVAEYRRAGGPALPPTPAGPWAAVDAVARAGAVHAAASVVRRAIHEDRPLDEVDHCLLQACERLDRHR